jgi:hydrogenase-4 component B
MALVVIARDGVLFLIAWEVMAVAAFFAATVEDDNPNVRQAGWVYLVATHIGTLCLMAMFALWRHATGSFVLEPANNLSGTVAGTLFVLSIIGFGFKAGLMPLHVWLPGAHANAPSHVSAVMSGVMLKMGIYGIMRMTALMPTMGVWWGGALLVVGAITGLAGIAFAIGQQDVKRLLAYSSIENIGIISIGLGLALLGRYQGRSDLMLLGLSGALLHVWNHGLFKSLLFLNAGAIIHAAHTRDIDQMGGLARLMPKTMILFVAGAIAICALPPLNGFISEWLIYIGLFRTFSFETGPGFHMAALGAVALAMIGSLAIACFVKLLGTVFLGTARSESVEHARECPGSMLVPMAVLAAGCCCIGIFPVLIAGVLENATRLWAGSFGSAVSLEAFAPLSRIGTSGLYLLVLTGLVLLILKIRLRSKIDSKAGTWDCGYAEPSKRMQYTGSSLGDSIVKLFHFILWPRSQEPNVSGIFPHRAGFKRVVTDTVLDKLVLPLFRIGGHYLPMIRVFQRGQIHLYVLYILVIVIVLLVLGR